MSDTRDLRKRWGGLLGAFGVAAGRGPWRAPRLPSNFTRQPGGGISERRRGWGSAFQPSNVPKAKPLTAIDNGTSGSTMATGDSPALNVWRGQQMKREKRARLAWEGGGGLFGSLFRGVGEGGLAKRATFDEAKHHRDADGKFAPKAEAAPRAIPGGPKFSPTRRSIYSQYRPSEAPEAAPPVNPQIDPASVRYPEGTRLSFPERGYFALTALRPQVPAKLGQEGYAEIARWAGQATTDARVDIYERAAAKGLIPGEGRRDNEAKLDPKAVRAAYNHARNLALHDVGLIAYDWRHSDEGVEAMRPLVPFMRYTRDSLQNVLLSGRPGEWAAFRREFGTPFKDGRTYQHDTRGQKAGEPKKAFERHLNFLKDKDGKAPRMAELGRARPEPMRRGAVEKLAKAVSPVLARWAKGTKWNAEGLSRLGPAVQRVAPPFGARGQAGSSDGMVGIPQRGAARFFQAAADVKSGGRPDVRAHELAHYAHVKLGAPLLRARGTRRLLEDVGNTSPHIAGNYLPRDRAEEAAAMLGGNVGGRHHGARWNTEFFRSRVAPAFAVRGASPGIAHLPRAIRREFLRRGLLHKRYRADAQAAAPLARLKKADVLGVSVESPEHAAARRARMAARKAERKALWAQPGYLRQALADWNQRVAALKAASGEGGDAPLTPERDAWAESRRVGGARPLTDAEIEQRRAAARSPRRGSSPGRMPEGLAARLARPEMPKRRGAGVMTPPQAPARQFGPGRVAAAMAGGALIGGLGVTGWHAWQRRKANAIQPA
jgi:hypothetical protein